jgi:hypothetical protein
VWCSDTGREQLFLLQQNPTEEHDLAGAPEQAAILHELREHFIAELKGGEEGCVVDRTIVPGRRVSPVLLHVMQDPDYL